jgi:lipopolysaccharide/colanic/teichoic acid biosynthesis glycosyltransferase
MYRQFGKRLLDLVSATCAMVLLAPVFVALALLVRWKLGSPILFAQQRPGWRGRPFTLLKFRTMIDSRAPDGSLRSDAERLVPFGRFLRSASLDELPELWNVLRGDMSLFGPRPLLMQYLERYTPDQMRRHDVRPGISGWAQVNGRNAQTWEDRFRFDLWYVDHLSLALDMRILLLTLKKVVQREGIQAEGHATMPEFTGSPPHLEDAHPRT